MTRTGWEALGRQVQEIADHFGVSANDVAGELAERFRDGSTRPGSWEAEHVRALLGRFVYAADAPSDDENSDDDE